MSLILLFVVLLAVAVYWVMTQILPERRQASLLRPALAEGLVATLNDRRHQMGMPILELDEELMLVAENKAVHQIMTARSEEGWEYPSSYHHLFGRSLLIETLFSGPAETMADRMARQRDVLDGEWIRCGIGVAGGSSSQIVVALILCREAWEPAVEVAREPLVVSH